MDKLAVAVVDRNVMSVVFAFLGVFNSSVQCSQECCISPVPVFPRVLCELSAVFLRVLHELSACVPQSVV